MRTQQEKTFVSFDGTSIFYRYWPSADAKKRAIVLFHRGHEHSGRLQQLVDELALEDCTLFAWDARGHGLTPGERGFSPSIGTSIKDVDSFIKHICDTYGIDISNITIIAQSVAAVLVSAWVHDYAPRIRGMVLASPAFKIKLYVPLARSALQLMKAFRGTFFVNSYVKAKYLTHDPERIASYESDPLISRPIAVNILLSLYETANRLIADAKAIETPTQLLISGSDWVVHKKPQHDFFDQLGSSVKEQFVLDGFYHDTFGEKERHLAINKAREFITRLYANPLSYPSLLRTDQSGYTRKEYDSLTQPLSPLSPKGLLFAASRRSMASLGRLSAGIDLGFCSGFDSGSTLDYVYRNQPEGITPLGKLFDWLYLNAIGWRGIRIRKKHLERALCDTFSRLNDARLPVHILDIAAGHGRYVLDALADISSHVESLRLQDASSINVAAGVQLIKKKGLSHLAHFEQGDAFDEKALSELTPGPTLAVVSGLYELFPENVPVRESLRGLACAMTEGSYLIYTNQPWHPQIEFIARVLTSHRKGQPWVMRRRTQLEMDQLVEAAGFQKVDQYIDDWGIFSVSVARRMGEHND